MSDRLYPAEWVLPGHPDKLCDAIADSLVELAAVREKRALCGVEVAVHLSSVFVTGRIACAGAEEIDVREVTRSIFESAGYNRHWEPDPSTLQVSTRLCTGPLNEGEAEFRSVSDDQSIVTGYATCNPGFNYLPPEQWLASRAGYALAELGRKLPDLKLGPDGKCLVIYDDEHRRLQSFSASLQQSIEGSEVDLYREVRRSIGSILQECATLMDGFCPELPEAFLVNGAGNFAVGGPEGDNGLSGKKLVVDGYGPRVSIGGGALSGKDFFKADRAGAILARRIAKTVVMAGATNQCTATLAIFPGDQYFRLLSLIDGSSRDLGALAWSRLFDLSLESAGERYALTPNLARIAWYGHFTRGEQAWEQIRL